MKFKIIKDNEIIGVVKGTDHILTNGKLLITIFNENEIVAVMQIKDFKQTDKYSCELYL